MRWRRALPWLSPSDRHGSARPDIRSSLLLVSLLYVIWGMLGLVLGPVWLAVTGRNPDVLDEWWSVGDEP